ALVTSELEYAQVAKELAALNESIALLRKLGSAASEKARLAAQLGEEQQRAGARDKVAAAEMALKVADLVSAAQYAKDLYASAKDNLERAQSELKQNNFAAATTSADLAKAKADEAAKSARPEYEHSEQHKTDKARDEALSRDAAAISSLQVR